MPCATPEAQREYQRKWVASRRREFMADKHCEACGSVAELELHHRDPNQKVSHSIWSWSEARRLPEIAKCKILCAGCHRRFHSEARRVEAELRNPCGTIAAYHRGCKCEMCMLAKRESERERRARRAAA